MVGFYSDSVRGSWWVSTQAVSGGRGGFLLRQCQRVVVGFRSGSVRGSWWVSAQAVSGGRGGFPLRQCQGVVMGLSGGSEDCLRSFSPGFS